MARGIDVNDYYSTDLEGNPIPLTMPMGEVKGAAMKFVTKGMRVVFFVCFFIFIVILIFLFFRDLTYHLSVCCLHCADADKQFAPNVTSPSLRPSRPVSRPPHWDNRNMKLLPPKYQNTLAHSNVDMERINNDDDYRSVNGVLSIFFFLSSFFFF
jgi:hypothetical protein